MKNAAATIKDADAEIRNLTVAPEKFNVFGLSGVFTVSPDVEPQALRDAADILLDLVEDLSTALVAQSAVDDITLASVIQFLTGASKASYRSLVGQP